MGHVAWLYSTLSASGYDDELTLCLLGTRRDCGRHSQMSLPDHFGSAKRSSMQDERMSWLYLESLGRLALPQISKAR